MADQRDIQDYLDANSLEVVKTLEAKARELGPNDPLTMTAYYLLSVLLRGSWTDAELIVDTGSSAYAIRRSEG